jgi:hypothetical protein
MHATVCPPAGGTLPAAERQQQTINAPAFHPLNTVLKRFAIQQRDASVYHSLGRLLGLVLQLSSNRQLG